MLWKLASCFQGANSEEHVSRQLDLYLLAVSSFCQEGSSLVRPRTIALATL